MQSSLLGRCAKMNDERRIFFPESGKKKRNHKSKKPYSIYIYKLVKQIHPDIRVDSKAMSIVNSFLIDIFDWVAVEASRLVEYTKRNTIAARDIQTAIRILLPGELAKHAESVGRYAFSKYTESK